jgi:hypothetical protein
MSYGVYFGLNREFALRLAMEDGFFEYLTACLFFVASLYFGRIFFRDGNWFFLLFAIVFLVGCGEEISWGQRIFGFEVPETIEARNRQGEFNLHNLDLFHPQEGANSKQGWAKLITVDFLYNVFWFGWGILIPFLVFLNAGLESFIKRIKLPLPPLSLGALFLVNFLLFVVLRKSAMLDKSDIFYQKIREVFEACSALIFAVVSYLLFRLKKSN